MRKTLLLSGAVLAILAAYLLLWPVPVAPVAWQAPQFAGYQGPHVRNRRLTAMRMISVAPETGPEHIAFGPDGRLYTGVLSGAILRMNPDGSQLTVIGNTGGRPLGMEFDAAGRLIIADAMRGLLALETDGRLVPLQTNVTPRVEYADAVAIANDGKILYTDASQRITPRQFGTFDAAVLDILEHSCTGRLLEFDPARATTRTIAGGLCFPNGVALTADEQYVVVAETGSYRIWRFMRSATDIDVSRTTTGAAPGAATLLLDNLPGFPDNVTRDARGRFWTGFTKPRSSVIDRMAGKPWLRAVTLRLPRAMWPVPPVYGHVIAFDADGKVLLDLQDPSGKLPETSGATAHDGQLYVQSLHASAIGVLTVDTAPD